MEYRTIVWDREKLYNEIWEKSAVGIPGAEGSDRGRDEVSAVGRFRGDHLLPVGERPLRAGQHHSDLEQELWRLGRDFRGPDYRDRDSGSAATPLYDDQHS